MAAPARDDHLGPPHPDRFRGTPQQLELVVAVHHAAIERGLSMYRDPFSGAVVMTAQYLADRGYCCNAGCRHCPYVGA